MAFHFINADLEITAGEPLYPVRDALAAQGPRLFELFCGEIEPGIYLARFEIHPGMEPEDETSNPGEHSAERKIEAFCQYIRSLEGTAADLWRSAIKREIDLGYDSDNHCRPFHDHLPPPVLAQMAELGIILSLTLYPAIIGADDDTPPF